MKQCKKCGEWLELEQFYTHPQTADGYRSVCKKCHLEKTLQYQRNKWIKKRIAIDKELIRNKRVDLGISRSKMAELTGINFYTYCGIEKNCKETSLGNWEKIKKVLKLD